MAAPGSPRKGQRFGVACRLFPALHAHGLVQRHVGRRKGIWPAQRAHGDVLRGPVADARQGEAPAGHGITVRLGYRPPYDADAMLAFFARRAIDAVE
ncbi:MAG: hypothetical protein EOO25_13305, partial [Comamonadaceae bacterium]